MAQIIIKGIRSGNTVMQEPEIRAAMEAGDTVFVVMRGVYFSTELVDDVMKFKALPERPKGAVPVTP